MSIVRKLVPLVCALAAVLRAAGGWRTRTTWVFHGADSARVLESHRYIEIYDHECDGHYIHVRTG